MIKELRNLLFGQPLYNIYTGERLISKRSWKFRKHQFYWAMKRKVFKYKKTLKAPICYIFGHATYEASDWSYHRIYCKRCNYMKSLWESSHNVIKK
jgi:hypothetical protein